MQLHQQWLHNCDTPAEITRLGRRQYELENGVDRSPSALMGLYSILQQLSSSCRKPRWLLLKFSQWVSFDGALSIHSDSGEESVMGARTSSQDYGGSSSIF